MEEKLLRMCSKSRLNHSIHPIGGNLGIREYIFYLFFVGELESLADFLFASWFGFTYILGAILSFISRTRPLASRERVTGFVGQFEGPSVGYPSVGVGRYS